MSDNASPERAIEATRETPPKGKWWDKPADILTILANVGGVIGLVQLAWTISRSFSDKGLLEPAAFFRTTSRFYYASLLLLVLPILLSHKKWIRISFAVALVSISIGFPMLANRVESGLSHDESEYNFERDNQDWTVGIFRFGVRLGAEPLISADQAFAGRQSLAFDVQLWGVDKAEAAGTAQLKLVGYHPPSGSMLVAHIYLPPDAPDNVMAQFALMAQEKDINSSAPASLSRGRWTSLPWVLPSEATMGEFEVILRFYLGWASAPAGRMQNQWEGRVFIDSVEVIPPVSAAYITPTSSPSSSPTPTSSSTPSPTPTTTPTPAIGPTPTETTTYAATPEPTYTATPTRRPLSTPRPTSTPTPPVLEPAPVLTSPPDGSDFRSGEQSIMLQWIWNLRELRPQEFFAVRIWPAEQPGVGHSIAWGREPFYRLDISHFDSGLYKWDVAVVRTTQQAERFWEPLSYDSSIWVFKVSRRAQPPGPEPAPTPR